MSTIEARRTRDGSINYRVKIRLKGASPATATFSRKTDARRWAEKTQTEIREGRYFKSAEAKRRTVGELIDRYVAHALPKKPKDLRNRKAKLDWWKSQIGHLRLSDLTPAVIADKRDALLSSEVRRQRPDAPARKKSPATVKRYLAALSHALSLAVREWNWIDANPMSKVSKPSEPRGRTRHLSQAELERLLKACQDSKNHHLYTLVVLAVSTGMRRGEAVSLRRKDVDCKAGQITLEDTKNGDRRAVPLAGRALALLEKRLATPGQPDDLLFPGVKRDKPTLIDAAWANALEKADIKDFRFHDLRHCTATYLLEAGATAMQVAGVLGHRTLQMVKRYAHVRESLATQLVADMNRQIFPEG